MGKRGPKAKPSHLKVVQGTARADRGPKNEPKPELITPDCPEWLDDYAREEWDRVTPELAAANLLSLIDRAALAAYCQTYSRWRAAEERIAESGELTYESKDRVYIHPDVRISDDAMKQMRAFLEQFGMSPSARSRISLPEKPQKDTAADFLFRAKKANK